jgi:hypothetical protein
MMNGKRSSDISSISSSTGKGREFAAMGDKTTKKKPDVETSGVLG